MEFMLMFLVPEGAPAPAPEAKAAMARFAETLAERGQLRRGAPLARVSEGARVRVRDGRTSVTDGPFAETKEVLAGFWVVDVADRAEALEVAGRCPHAQDGVVQLHPVAWRRAWRDPEEGRAFFFAFRHAPDLADPDRTKIGRMIAYSESLARRGQLFETAPLAGDPPPARVTTKRGVRSVTDGPFTEVKEGVGGYGVVRIPDRAAALALAADYPHATWGSIEVREILFFDRA